MTPSERKEHLTFLGKVAECAARAADHTGRERELSDLRACTERQEREHRAFGRGLVGNIGARMSVRQAGDYFVARVLAEGALTFRGGKAPIAKLSGLREDYVRGAILMGNGAFRGAFLARLAEAFPVAPKATLTTVLASDYCKLVQS